MPDKKMTDMDGLRYSPDHPYYRLMPVHACLYVQVCETGEWDLLLGPLKWARAETATVSWLRGVIAKRIPKVCQGGARGKQRATYVEMSERVKQSSRELDKFKPRWVSPPPRAMYVCRNKKEAQQFWQGVLLGARLLAAQIGVGSGRVY